MRTVSRPSTSTEDAVLFFLVLLNPKPPLLPLEMLFLVGCTNVAERGGRPHGEASSASRGWREAEAAHLAEDGGHHHDHPLRTLVSLASSTV